MRLVKELKYYEEIDFIKAIAIMAVIVLHTVPSGEVLISYFMGFWLWQALPVLMVIAGINSSLSMLAGKYSIIKSLKRILIPYSMLWVVYFLCSYHGNFTIKSITTFYFSGIGRAVGDYFVVFFIQHIVFFPFVWWLISFMEKKIKNKYKIMFLFFCIALLLEGICVYMGISVHLYTYLYIRHFFTIFLGIFIVKNGISKKVLLFSTLLSSAYILFIGYFNQPEILQGLLSLANSWHFEHAPGSFYALFVVVVLWKSYKYIRPLARHTIFIGKASWHIYLAQAFLIMRIGRLLRGNVIFSLIVCVVIGVLFYKNQPRIEKWFKKIINTKI